MTGGNKGKESRVTMRREEKCPKFNGDKAVYLEWKGKVEDWVWSVKESEKYPGISVRNSLTGEPWQLVKDLKREDIAEGEGWKKIIDILDKKYRMDEKREKIANMNELFKIQRTADESIQDYVSRFDAILRKSMATGMDALSEEHKGGLLLVRSGLSDNEEKIVTGVLDGEVKYNRVCQVLRSVMGDSANSKSVKSERSESSWWGERGEKKTLRCFGCNKAGHMKYACPERGERSENRRCMGCGMEGHLVSNCRFKESKCFACGEKGHLKFQCKNASEGKPDKPDKTVYLGKAEDSLENMEEDIWGIIDTGCPSTVIGEL